MKSIHFLSFACAASFVTAAVAQDTDPDVVRVPLSDPARPARLVVGILAGGITVKGHDGKEVEVRAGAREDDEEAIERPPAPDEPGRTPRPPRAPRAPAPEAFRDRGPRRDRRADGMRRIPNTSTGLEIVENDNTVQIETSSWRNPVDLEIRVPRRTSVTLSTVNDGDIEVQGVEGEIEVENTNGEVTLVDVSGSVLAHALNGDVVVSFVKLEPKKSMSFSSLNGDIDVTFPTNLMAELRLKADNGEIYTDFDFDLRSRSRSSSSKTESTPQKDKKGFRFEHESQGMSASVGGGGPTIRLETFNGNIYVRKRK